MSNVFGLLGSQNAIFIQWKLNPKSTQYNIPFIFPIPDEISSDCFLKALKNLIEIHPQLRTCFEMDEEGSIQQRVFPNGSPIEQIQTSESELEETLSKLIRPFDLLAEIPVRFVLITTEKQRYFFHDIHHISFDGFSYVPFMNDLEKLLRGEIPEKESMSLSECVREEQIRRKDHLEEDFVFYDSVLAGQSKSDIPVKSDRTPSRLQNIIQSWPADAINAFLKDQPFSANVLFSSAFALVLSRFSNENCASFCMISHGRPCRESIGTIGGFSRSIPLAVLPDPKEKILDYLEKNRILIRETLRHQAPATNEIFQRYGITPEIFFVFQKGVNDLHDGLLVSRRLSVNEPVMPFAVEIYVRKNEYEVRLTFDEGIYEQETIEALLRSFRAVLHSMIEHPDWKCGQIETVDEEEKQSLLKIGKGESYEYDTHKTIIDHFREQAAKNPDQIAIVFQEKKLTYGELDLLTDKLAAYLRDKGTGPEKRVGIMIDRSELMAIYPLAVLKAGGAYVPLDSHFPEDRLSFMIENTGLEIILSEDDLVKRTIPSFQGHIFNAVDLANLPDPIAIPEGPSPENAFVVLYTSGTTGKPKGCVIEHHNIMNFCYWYMRTIPLTSSDRISACHNFGFDPHMIDFYPSYLCGGTIYVISSAMRMDLLALKQYFIENKVSVACLTTRLGQQFAESFPNAISKCLSVGGEALTSIHLPNYRMFNMYGPTECTITATAYLLEKQDEISPPIGRPLSNYSLYILDSSQALLPKGIPGELYIGGKGVGRGYIGLPELTEKRFLPNPFGEGRIYRTGDRVRWNKDNNIEYLERMDNQVKLRGFRIELGEVEHALNSYEPITDAVALVREVGGNQTLCAWFTAQSQVDLNDLRQYLSGVLTEFMIPALFLQMQSFPFNANGKVDRKNLPDILPMSDDSDDVSEEAGKFVYNRLEAELAGLVEKILGISNIGLNVDLVRMGLTSLTAIKLAIQIEKKFHVNPDILSLLRSCTLRDLEDRILQNWLENSPNQDQANGDLRSQDSESQTIKEFPLTSPQLGIYYDCMKDPMSTAYNIPMHYRFPSNFDADKLTETLKTVLSNHPVFFSQFQRRGENLVQIIQEERHPVVEQRDFDQNQFNQYLNNFTKPFDLEKDSLYRAAVIRTELEVALVFDVHHIIADGISISLLLQELADAWDGKEIPSERCSYAQYAQTESQSVGGSELKEAEEFFKKRLASMDSVSEILPDYNADPLSGHLAEEIVPVDAKAIQTFCRENGITEASFYLSGTCLAISRFTGQRAVAISMISSGRSDLRLQNTVGMFVRTLPFTTVIDPKIRSIDYAQSINEHLRETIVHEKISFTDLAVRYAYLPKIMFACELDVAEPVPIGEMIPELSPLRMEKPKFPVSVHIEKRRGRTVIIIQYNDALYKPFRMKMLAESLKQALLAIKNYSENPIGSQSLISEEQKKDLSQFHCRAETPISEGLIHRIFEKTVDNNPDKTALIACDGTWTFSELDTEANRMAHALIACGIRRGDRVAYLLPRTSRVIISMFGILKTGAAFIPCDPDYPRERIQQILEDSGAKILITTPELSKQYGLIAVDVEFLLTEIDTARPRMEVHPEDLAYLIYTSGSSGKPKGVMLEHRGISNYVMPHPANPHVFALKNEARAFLSITTVSFDMSLKEILPALCNGISLVLADSDQARHPGKLAQLFAATGADAFNATPSRMRQFLVDPAFRDAIAHCRILMAGGETFPQKLLKDLHEITQAKIFNTYGPTEITVSSNGKDLSQEDQKPTIGRPFLNYREFIVDPDGNELPPCAAGELLIGGPCIARGYVNLPEKTASAFTNFGGVRVYRSGDCAEWLENGEIALLGRIDNQLKLRGLRIEASEVENAVSSFDGIHQAAVAVRSFGDADYLCCWFSSEREMNMGELKSELQKRLPLYMIPALFTRIDSIPVNFNGKIDYKALPDPAFDSSVDYVPPQGETEQILCDIFKKVLHRDRVGALDNFFDLGGTSLSVTQIIVETEKQSLDITYKDLFAHPTPRSLALLFSTRFQESDHPESKNDSDSRPDPDQKNPILSDSSSDEEITQYDYSRINDLLSENTIDSFRTGSLQKTGSVLITGTTGYLGVHLLAAYLDQEEGTAYCLIRPKKDHEIEKRLKTMMFYYFGEKYEAEFGKRILVVPGDITDPDSLQRLNSLDVDCVINCAANVKHFSAHTDIDDINHKGIQNLIDFCKGKGCRLVQVSTTSVAGNRAEHELLSTDSLTEQHLYFGQDVGNQYVRSKFLAERALLEAALDGLSVKILRVGNLSARVRDGEFQANFGSNSFVGRLKAYFCIGKVPYSIAGQTAEFAPIDSTAEAILKLIQTPEKCRIFHIYNPHGILLGDVIFAMKKCHLDIDLAEEEEFIQAYEKAASDPECVKYMLSLLAYRASSSQPMIYIPKVNGYTLQILFRMGWKWPVISQSYLVKFVDMLCSLGFFN